jgi:hypothetical protein
VAPAAYLQIYFALIGHPQRAELVSTANSSEKYYKTYTATSTLLNPLKPKLI